MEALDVVCKYFKAEFGEKQMTNLRRKLKSSQNKHYYIQRKFKAIETKYEKLVLRLFFLELELALRRENVI